MACHGCHVLGVHYYFDSFAIGASILVEVVIWVRSKEVGKMDGLSKSLVGGLRLGDGVRVKGVPLMKFCSFFNFFKIAWLFVAFICSKASSHFNVVCLKPYSLE